MPRRRRRSDRTRPSSSRPAKPAVPTSSRRRRLRLRLRLRLRGPRPRLRSPSPAPPAQAAAPTAAPASPSPSPAARPGLLWLRRPWRRPTQPTRRPSAQPSVDDSASSGAIAAPSPQSSSAAPQPAPARATANATPSAPAPTAPDQPERRGLLGPAGFVAVSPDRVPGCQERRAVLARAVAGAGDEPAGYERPRPRRRRRPPPPPPALRQLRPRRPSADRDHARAGDRPACAGRVVEVRRAARLT